MRFWDGKDANGNKLTDGRVCLVIRSEENPDMPEIRTYGKDKEEVLDKIAKTAETAQAQIHKMRKQPNNPPPPRPAAAAGATDVAKAITDLANPATAPAAVKTLLRAGGVDVDVQAQRDALKAIADLAESWENSHPDYPKDPRNDQILINKASVMAGSVLRITAQTLDAAYEELVRREMFFEPKPVQPRGSEAPRTEAVEATSYRQHTLSSSAPAAATPGKENAKEQKFRKILEEGTGRDVDNAIRGENAGNREFAGFQKFAAALYAKTA